MNEQAGSYGDLLRVRGLPAALVATLLSRFGGRMFLLAIVLYALTRFNSPALAGWLTFAAVAPGLVVSPVAGVLLDRIGPSRAVAVDMAVSAASIMAIIAADRCGVASPALLFILITIFSLSSPLSAAGLRTMLPRLVPIRALVQVNAIDTAIFAATDVGGPALAGLLIGVAGPRPALAAIVIVYGVAAICVSRVRIASQAASSPGSVLRQAIDGIGAVVRQPTLRGLVIAYGLYQVTWGVLAIAVPVLIGGVFSPGTRDAMTGSVWAGVGIAGGLGALLAGHPRAVTRERAVMAIGMIVTALAVWPVAAHFGLGGIVVGLLLAGLLAGPIDVALLTLRQRRTDPRQFARVLAVSISLNVAGFPIGSALGGVLVTQSLTMTFAVAGLASALAALAVGMIPGDRQRDRDPTRRATQAPG